MKPSGVDIVAGPSGFPTFQVVRASRAEDAIWEAVEEAILAGWSPKRFISEAQSAWSSELNNMKQMAMREFP